MTYSMVTIEEAAKLLRMSRSTLHHLTAARQIGFCKLGRRIYFTPEDLDRYVESRRFEPLNSKLER